MPVGYTLGHSLCRVVSCDLQECTHSDLEIASCESHSPMPISFAGTGSHVCEPIQSTSIASLAWLGCDRHAPCAHVLSVCTDLFVIRGVHTHTHMRAHTHTCARARTHTHTHTPARAHIHTLPHHLSSTSPEPRLHTPHFSENHLKQLKLKNQDLHFNSTSAAPPQHLTGTSPAPPRHLPARQLPSTFFFPARKPLVVRRFWASGFGEGAGRAAGCKVLKGEVVRQCQAVLA